MAFELPFNLSSYGWFNVDAKNGNIYLMYSLIGMERGLMVWNPLTRKVYHIIDPLVNTMIISLFLFILSVTFLVPLNIK